MQGGRGVGAGGGFTGVLQLSGAVDCVGAGVVGGDSTFLAAAVVAALARLVVPLADRLLVAARLLVDARLLLAGSVVLLPLPLALPVRLVVTPARARAAAERGRRGGHRAERAGRAGRRGRGGHRAGGGRGRLARGRRLGLDAQARQAPPALAALCAAAGAAVQRTQDSAQVHDKHDPSMTACGRGCGAACAGAGSTARCGGSRPRTQDRLWHRPPKTPLTFPINSRMLAAWRQETACGAQQNSCKISRD